MIDIVESLKKKETLFTLEGVSAQQIEAAENELSLRFAEDYVQYVSAFGIASYDNHELTGICQAERLNVVAVTKKNRGILPELNKDWYVVEQMNMDGVIICQDSTGAVFQTSPGNDPVRVCNSLTEYISFGIQ